MVTTPSAAKLRVFTLSRRLVEIATDGVTLLHGALWLGLLRHAELNELTARNYAASPSHTSESFNLSGFDAWERAALGEYFDRCRSMLVGGAGGGREVIALCRQEIRADGFECNPRLAALASRLLAAERLPGTVQACAADEVPASLGTYDGGIVGAGAYMHVAGRGNRVRFLREFAAHLVPGAPLLVSFPVRREARRDRYVALIARAIQGLRGAERNAEAGDAVADAFTHHFTEHEIAEELGESGFELACFRPKPFGHAVATLVGRERRPVG